MTGRPRKGSWEDIDEVVVEMAMEGRPPANMNIGERHVAIQEMVGRGVSDTEIARRMKCCVRTVQRHRRRGC